MVPTDSGHLRKYLTTLGVAVIAATISMIGLLYRLPSDLLLTTDELGDATPTAQKVVELRQDHVLLATQAAPALLLIGVATGIALMAIGINGWAKMQRQIDAEQLVRLRTAMLTYDQMTDAEKSRKLAAEAAEILSDGGAEFNVRDTPTPSASTPNSPQEAPFDSRSEGVGAHRQPSETQQSGTEVGSHTVSEPPGISSPLSDARLLQEKISTIESLVLENLVENLGQEFTIRRDVSIRQGPDRLSIDALILNNTNSDAYGLEIKYIASPKNLRNRLNELIAYGARMEGSGLKARAIVIIGDRANPSEARSIEDRIGRLRLERSSIYSHISTIRESSLEGRESLNLAQALDIS